MAKFCFFSKYADGLPIAYRLQEEGHEVTVWIEDKAYAKRYDGLLTKVTDYEEMLEDDAICLFDMTGIGNGDQPKPETEEEWSDYTNLPQQLREQGYSVIGGGVINDRMEFDRTWASQLAKRAGLHLPQTKKFEDLDEAIEFVEGTKKRYVSKPHGNLGTMKNYLSRDWEDMVQMLHFYKRHPEMKDAILELQEWVDGQQMGIEGWVVDHRFTTPNITFEFKPLLHGGHGPLTGETGSIIAYIPKGMHTRIQTEVLDKISPLLEELDYPDGPLDINCMINFDDGYPYFLEFSPRFGYPAEILQLDSVKDDWGEAFESITNHTFAGFTPKPFHWFSCVLVTVPRWPYDAHDGEKAPAIDYKGAPMFHRLTTEHLKSIHLVDAYKEKGEILALGLDGHLMTVTAMGNSIREAEAKMYQTVGEIELHTMMYRGDVGENILLKELLHHNYWIPAER